jgi:ribosomal protein S5
LKTSAKRLAEKYTEIKVVKTGKRPDYYVNLVVGNQYFHVNPIGMNKTEIMWMRRMLGIALKKIVEQESES